MCSQNMFKVLYLILCNVQHVHVHMCVPACVCLCMYVRMYKHCLTYITINFQQKFNFAYVRSVCTYTPLYLYTEGSQVKIKNPAHQNLISCSMTALPHTLSCSSILLPPHSMHFKALIFQFL